MGAVSIPSPVGGWNARDALEAMEPADAVELINWVPGNGVVTGRGGSLTKIELPGSVDSLIPYIGASSAELLAVYGGNISQITSFTTPDVLGSGFVSDAWQYAAFDNKLVLCNGQDAAQVYDGTTLSPMTITSGPSASSLVGVVNFKGRAFYWQTNAQSFWYAEAGSFQGDLTEFPFAMFVQRGGYLVQVITWTRDSGDGVDDYCAFIFSTGETLIYQGDDPGNALQWGMVGRFQLGAPLGIRAHCRFASTEIALTDDGFVGLDEAIQNARTQVINTFGGKIVRAAKAAAKAYRQNFGWEAVYYPAGNLFLANIPIADGISEQYVKNTNTGAWCKFKGWNARCFAVFNDRLYFGTIDGKVVLADVSANDGVQKAYSDDGQPIQYEALTAYQKFGQPGLKSQLTAARLVMNAFDPRAVSINAFADYRVKILPPVINPVEQVQGQWDVSYWDEDYWAGENNDPTNVAARPTRRPITAFGFANAISVRYRSVVQNVNWYSTFFEFKQAGVN